MFTHWAGGESLSAVILRTFEVKNHDLVIEDPKVKDSCVLCHRCSLKFSGSNLWMQALTPTGLLSHLLVWIHCFSTWVFLISGCVMNELRQFYSYLHLFSLSLSLFPLCNLTNSVCGIGYIYILHKNKVMCPWGKENNLIKQLLVYILLMRQLLYIRHQINNYKRIKC